VPGQRRAADRNVPPGPEKGKTVRLLAGRQEAFARDRGAPVCPLGDPVMIQPVQELAKIVRIVDLRLEGRERGLTLDAHLVNPVNLTPAAAEVLEPVIEEMIQHRQPLLAVDQPPVGLVENSLSPIRFMGDPMALL
jgi:hypothetical protein